MYASKNSSGERSIFYCRVLVGKTVQGSEGMRFLPQTGGQQDPDCAVDDVGDPTIFVIFKDAQAYPEYRIVFKDKWWTERGGRGRDQAYVRLI